MDDVLEFTRLLSTQNWNASILRSCTHFLWQIVRQMLDPEEGEKLRQKIDDTTHSYDYYGPINYHIDVTDGTTHLSVLDEEGNAVSITTSINK